MRTASQPRTHFPIPRFSVLAAAMPIALFVLFCWTPHRLLAASYDPAEDTPTTNTDVSAYIATGSGYDGWTGSGRRIVTDIKVPAALGSQGLEVVRTYSSSGFGGGYWSFSYGWSIQGRPSGTPGYLVYFPDGRTLRFEIAKSTQTGETALRAKRGTNERLYLNGTQLRGGTADLWLEDGSIVHFRWYVEQAPNDAYWIDYFTPTSWVDPHGQVTTVTYEQYDYEPGHIRLKQVTDPAGRTLTYTYDPNGPNILTQITASTGQWARYTWPNYDPNSPNRLTRVDYSDGTSAIYTYKFTPVQTDPCEGCSPDPGFSTSSWSTLATAQDTRAAGTMPAIMYDYAQNTKYSTQAGAHNYTGVVAAERHYPDRALVSGFDRPSHTETRGDGPSRQFTFKELNDKLNLVTQKSDFKGVNELFGYDANNYLQTYTDRRNHVTTYTNEPILGHPKQIKHPDGTHIDYTYTDNANPYYIQTKSDERGSITTYRRDANHRVWRVDYPPDANGVQPVEEFSYNGFGQVWKHRRKNGAFDYLQYDGRGLLIRQWNPTRTDVGTNPASVTTLTSPATGYSYYAAGDPIAGNAWIDRIKTITHPANASGLVAAETFEYDRTYVNGVSTGVPCPGRGLITKITHADSPSSTYEAFGYDLGQQGLAGE